MGIKFSVCNLLSRDKIYAVSFLFQQIYKTTLRRGILPDFMHAYDFW